MKSLLKGLFCFCFLPAITFAQHSPETKLLNKKDGEAFSRYETIEIGIRIPSQERMFKLFLDDRTKGKNPYTQNFLRMQFACNGKTYNVPAFYMQEVVADEKANKYFTTETRWPWRVRFSVPDTGNWNCLILLGETVEMSVPKSCGISFQCVAGKNHGFLQVAPDQKHFQYTDGTPFFVLGQNIGWTDAPVLKGIGTWPNVGYYEVYHYINNLADNGGNYVRMVMGPWSTGIQWKEVGVYDQTNAFALDSMIRIAEIRGMKVHLCLDLTTGFITTDKPEDQNPIRRAYQKEGTTCADLLKDSLALIAFDNFIRYVYSRWAFSPTVATIELMGEQDRWDGYAGHENYFTDFYFHIQHLLKTEFGDNVHMISTSTNQEHMYLSKNSVFSFIDVHHYDNNFYCNKRRFNILNSRTAKKINKPFLFGELGMINGPVNAADAGDYEGCNDISMHNALWSTLFMGGAGTGSCWWSWSNDQFREANYKPIRYFIDSIAGDLLFSGKSEMYYGNGLESFYQVSPLGNTAIGWVHNTSYWWGNMMQNCKERNGKKMLPPKDDDKAEKPESRAGNKFEISGLKRKQYYLVKFYDTRNINQELSHVMVRANTFGVIHIPFPDVADCTFKLTRTFPVRINI